MMIAETNRPFKKTQLLFVVVFALCGFISKAQTVQRIFTFENGDTFKKRTFLNSTFIIQRGRKKLNITSSSSVYKTYKVIDVSDTGYKINITIPKMDVVINGAGHSLHYDSEEKADTSSKIELALQYMVGKNNTILVDRTGLILSENNLSESLANDTLLTFAGIQGESYLKGTQFNIIPDFVAKSKALKKGYKWKDTVTYNRQKMTTRFWIDQVTDAATIIKFKSFISGDLVNSNTTGTYIIDNKTGLQLQRLMQSISTGYQVLNGIVYSITRRVSISEDCLKKDDSGIVSPPDEQPFVVTR